MKVTIALAAAGLIISPALAAPCRDAKGHFAKCPPAGAMPGALSSKGSAASAMPTGVTKDSKGRCHGAGAKYVACPK